MCNEVFCQLIKKMEKLRNPNMFLQANVFKSHSNSKISLKMRWIALQHLRKIMGTNETKARYYNITTKNRQKPKLQKQATPQC